MQRVVAVAALCDNMYYHSLLPVLCEDIACVQQAIDDENWRTADIWNNNDLSSFQEE